MLFNSYIFVLIFLPVSVAGYFLFNKFKLYKAASAFLLGMSLWFYGYFNPSYLSIIILSILVNYGFYLLMERIKGGCSKVLLVTAIIFNLSILFYFKYFNFFIDNINQIFNTSFVFEKVVLPLGISFFTFQQIGFIIDSYKSRDEIRYDFLNYALFVSFFPQLIAGPIVTHTELVPQFQDKSKRTPNAENLSRGLLHFSLGLAKKVLIADVVGSLVDSIYSAPFSLSRAGVLAIMLAYTVQLYFDFSGYSDMAIGLGRMFNVTLPVNFNSPYSIKSPTISEYWNRNHITLTNFFTKYVYIPLGGSRKGTLRTYLNTMIVFTLSGLWHGSDWSFVLWGMIHGAAICLNRCFKKSIGNIPGLIMWIPTFIFHITTLVLFRSESISQAMSMYRLLITGNGLSFPVFTDKVEVTLIAGLIIMIIGFNAKDLVDRMKPNILYALLTVTLLTSCILNFQEVSTFLYFNF